MKGKVKWFDEQKGFGFIISDEDQKEYFFHFTEIQKPGFKIISDGQAVEFELKEDDQDRDQAVNIREIEEK